MEVFIDESQDAQYFVRAAVVTPDLLTLQDIVGDWRRAARRWQIRVQEFHESDLRRDHPRLLSKCLDLLAEAPRRYKRTPAPRQGLGCYILAYKKSPKEQQKETLLSKRLLEVYPEAFRRLIWALPSQETAANIVCDEFEKCQTIEPVLQCYHAKRFTGGGTMRFGSSQQVKPLQVADLVAGTMRRHIGEDPNEGRYEKLATLVEYKGEM